MGQEETDGPEAFGVSREAKKPRQLGRVLWPIPGRGQQLCQSTCTRAELQCTFRNCTPDDHRDFNFSFIHIYPVILIMATEAIPRIYNQAQSFGSTSILKTLVNNMLTSWVPCEDPIRVSTTLDTQKAFTHCKFEKILDLI